MTAFIGFIFVLTDLEHGPITETIVPVISLVVLKLSWLEKMMRQEKVL